MVQQTRGDKGLVMLLKERYSALVTGKSVFRTHADGSWRGHFRPLYKKAHESRKGFRAVLRFFKAAGLIVHPEPVRKDYYNLRNRLSTEEPHYPLSEFWKTTPSIFLYEGFDSDYPLGQTVVPFEYNLSKQEFACSPKDHINVLDHCPNLVATNYPLFQGMIGSLPPVEHYEKRALLLNKDVVGAVTLLTKDRGYKLRPVASAHRLIQQCLSRLSNTIYKDLKHKTSCFVFDQDAGASWIHDQLAAGHRMSSIDLTAASDNIPLAPMVSMMYDLYPNCTLDIKLFADVQRCFWWTPHHGLYIQWRRGSIQGVKGSFPGFTRWLMHMLKIAGVPSTHYAIVGDDLCLRSTETKKVLKMLKRFDIPVNTDKSIFNSTLGEFVGRLIDKHGSLDVFKGSPFNINDLTGLVRQYGFKALHRSSLKKIKGTRRHAIVSYVLYYKDRALRKSLAYYAKSKRDVKLLLGSNERVIEVGGCPPWLFLDMFAKTNPSQRALGAMKKVLKGRKHLPDDLQHCANLMMTGSPPFFEQRVAWAIEDFFLRSIGIGTQECVDKYPLKSLNPLCGPENRTSHFVGSWIFRYNREIEVNAALSERKAHRDANSAESYIKFLEDGIELERMAEIQDVPLSTQVGIGSFKNYRKIKRPTDSKPAQHLVERFHLAVKRSMVNYAVLLTALDTSSSTL